MPGGGSHETQKKVDYDFVGRCDAGAPNDRASFCGTILRNKFINISEVYASGPIGSEEKGALEYWRDTDIEVEGPAVAQFQRAFINEWKYQRSQELGQRDYFPTLDQKGNQLVRVIISVPERFSLIYVTLISAIVSSQTNIYITDAYFAPDHQVLHAKTTTIDGVWSTVGTSNLDYRARQRGQRYRPKPFLWQRYESDVPKRHRGLSANRGGPMETSRFPRTTP